MPVPAIDWNEKNIATLKKLWDEGLSASEIGRRMGITKSSAVGKAHRLGLSARPSPLKAAEKKEPKFVYRPIPIPVFTPFIDLVPAPVTDSVSATLTCLYLLGERKSRISCDKPRMIGSPSYCPEHHALCYVRRRPQLAEAAD